MRVLAVTTAAWLALATIPLGAQVTSARSATPGQSRFAQLERTISEEMRDKGIPGMTVLVIENGSVAYRRSFGISDVESGAPMSSGLLMQVGSITKVITALSANVARARGQVDFDAPIGRYLSGLSTRVARLTLGSLLSQTSGLRDEAADSGRQDEGALVEFARSLTDSALALPAGESFSYSNPGFALGGAVLQEALRAPFGRLVDDLVLRRLGMGHATMHPLDAMTFPRAAGHATDRAGRLRVVRPVANDTRFWPAGYLWASGEDMAQLLRALLFRRTGSDVPMELADAADSLIQPRVPVPGLPHDAHYGYGMFLDRWHGVRRAWHPGAMPGYSSLLEFLPDQQLGVVILANRDAIRLDRIAESALESLAVLPGDEPTLESTVKQAGAPSDQALRALEGTYMARFPVELRFRDGRLVLLRGGVELPMEALGDDRYAVRPNPSGPPEIFRAVPARGARPAYLQMLLWAFPRVRG